MLQNKFDDLKHRVETGSKRFKQCEDLANKLVANDSEYTSEIEKRQEEIRELWQQLIVTIENREKRLKAAGEIHRFHRDVADALSRINDKDATISDDLGRDLNSVLTLIRKHEGFENDLVALEAQLQVNKQNTEVNIHIYQTVIFSLDFSRRCSEVTNTLPWVKCFSYCKATRNRSSKLDFTSGSLCT